MSVAVLLIGYELQDFKNVQRINHNRRSVFRFGRMFHNGGTGTTFRLIFYFLFLPFYLKRSFLSVTSDATYFSTRQSTVELNILK